jgi:hypothetical protein
MNYEVPSRMRYQALEAPGANYLSFEVKGVSYALKNSTIDHVNGPVCYELCRADESIGEFTCIHHGLGMWHFIDYRIRPGAPPAILTLLPRIDFSAAYTEQYIWTTRDAADNDVNYYIVLRMNVIGVINALAHASSIEIGITEQAALAEAA